MQSSAFLCASDHLRAYTLIRGLTTIGSTLAFLYASFYFWCALGIPAMANVYFCTRASLLAGSPEFGTSSYSKFLGKANKQVANLHQHQHCQIVFKPPSIVFHPAYHHLRVVGALVWVDFRVGVGVSLRLV